MEILAIVLPFLLEVFDRCNNNDLRAAADERNTNERRFRRRARLAAHRAAKDALEAGAIDRSQRREAANAAYDEIMDANNDEVAACLAACA